MPMIIATNNKYALYSPCSCDVLVVRKVQCKSKAAWLHNLCRLWQTDFLKAFSDISLKTLTFK